MWWVRSTGGAFGQFGLHFFLHSKFRALETENGQSQKFLQNFQIKVNTYLCGHNHPIFGFALKFLSSSWSHKAKTGALRPVLFNAYTVAHSADDRRSPHQTLVSEERLHPSERLDLLTGPTLQCCAALF